MADTSSRRGFVRLILAEGARGARNGAMGTLAAAAAAMPETKRPGKPEEGSNRTVPARPAQRYVGADELDALIDQFGLGGRRSDVWGLVRTSVRLTLADGPATTSALFAGAAAPGAAGALEWNGRALHTLAQIDLSKLPMLGHGQSGLPGDGSLVLMWAFRDAPSGLSTEHSGSTAVVHLPGPDARRMRLRNGADSGARPVELSAELSLPRAWASQVVLLDLSESEHEGWQLLQRELALRQGVLETHEETSSSREISTHRLCGYPDERLGQMRQVCEAAALGIDLGDRPPHEHPRTRELETRAERWELLFQLSLDSDLSWEWGTLRRRLYVWIDREDLRDADFSRVWGITQ